MSWPHQGFSYRAPAVGTRGMVSSAHQLASLAGVSMIMRGGNAVDAAVATAAALTVVEPSSCGAGGVGCMVIAEPGVGRPRVLDFIGPAPIAASVDAFAVSGSKDDGIRSSIVPGAVAGWLEALARFGRLSRQEVLAPAIGHAREGFPVSPYLHRYIGRCADRLRRHPTTAAVFLPNGQVPQPGELLRQPAAAATLAEIAEQGRDAFYKGRVAEEIVRFSAANGGLLASDDLGSYAPRWLEPISAKAFGHTFFFPPPPSGGFQILLALRLLEGFDLHSLDAGSGDYVHLLAEAFKPAIAHRIHHARSPETVQDLLQSDSHVAEMRRAVDRETARAVEGERRRGGGVPNDAAPVPGPAVDRETTTHLVAMDRDGWAVACTQTLGGAFGGGIVHGSTGLLLNSLCHWFDLDPASPNVIGPARQPEQPLAPSQIWRDGRPFILVGTPGTFGILQTTPQIMLNLLLRGQSIQAAIEQPRFRLLADRELALESRFSEETRRQLVRRGHHLVLLDPWDRFVGGAHGVMTDGEGGSFFGGADPRRDGCAIGW